MRKATQLRVDLISFLATITLAVLGIMFVYSSGLTSNGQLVSREYLRQILWAVTGVGIMVTMAFLDPKRVFRIAPALYLGACFALVLTLFFGREVNGAKSWIGIGIIGGQPSEFAKVALIVILAWLYTRNPDSVSTLRGFGSGFVLALLPTVLTLLQPDFGTAMVFVPIFLGMSLVSGARIEHVLYVLLLIGATAVLVVLPFWAQILSNTPGGVIARSVNDPTALRMVFVALAAIFSLSMIGRLVIHRPVFAVVAYLSSTLVIALPASIIARRVLQDYQIMRLVVFADPYVDPRGAGWNIIQSMTAIGSGGLVGKGYLGGTHSRYQYLPQQSTDFIFSIMAEELGFIGSMVVYALFAVLIGRALYVGINARDRFGGYLTVGVAVMLFLHFAVNVGMAIGIMPITGIPLYFLSYGGSALWTAMGSIGLVMAVYHYRYQY